MVVEFKPMLGATNLHRDTVEKGSRQKGVIDVVRLLGNESGYRVLSAVQRRIRSRVLRLAVLSEAADRPGLEHLLRYCARPAFASERLAWDGSDQPVRYRLTKPLPTGQTELALTPLELLDRLAALMRRECSVLRHARFPSATETPAPAPFA